MRPRMLISVLATTVAAITLIVAAHGASAEEGKAPANPRPPYLVAQNEHLLVFFEADESALKSLLPPNIKPAAGNVVLLNMYRAQQTVGLVPYTATYLVINVDGFDSPDGTKGRWMVQGWYGPEPVPTVLRNQAGVPVQLGATRYERDGNRIHTVLTAGGADLIEATIELKDEKPVVVGGLLNYPAAAHNLATTAQLGSDVVVNRIPFAGELTPATPVSVELRLRDSDVAKVIRPKKLLQAAYYKGGAFALGFVDMNPPEMAAIAQNNGAAPSASAPAKQ